MEEAKLVRFDQQVAGHDKLMLLSTNDLIVVKPCKKRELDFYQDVLNFPEFQDFIPECYGTVRAATEQDLNLLDKTGIEENSLIQDDTIKIDTSESADQNLCLENILHGFTKPCILDLKMGSLLYDEDATKEKKDRMIQHSLNTTSCSLGLRISGLKVYDSVKRRYLSYDKTFGKSRVIDNSVEALLCFLFPNSIYTEHAAEYIKQIDDPPNNEESSEFIKEKLPTKYIRWIIECFIDTVKEIRESVLEHPNLRLIGSSLLFIFEGDRSASDKTWKHMLQEDAAPKSQEDETDEELPPKMCDLRLIDFAHSDWHANRSQQDINLVKGFDNILDILNKCLIRQQHENL